MRGIKAKKLRRLVYGSTSLRIEREYEHHNGGIRNKPGSPRGTYLLSKKGYRRMSHVRNITAAP